MEQLIRLIAKGMAKIAIKAEKLYELADEEYEKYHKIQRDALDREQCREPHRNHLGDGFVNFKGWCILCREDREAAIAAQ